MKRLFFAAVTAGLIAVGAASIYAASNSPERSSPGGWPITEQPHANIFPEPRRAGCGSEHGDQDHSSGSSREFGIQTATFDS